MRPYWFGAAVAIVLAAPAAQPGDACDGSFSVAGATTKPLSVYASIDRVFSEPGKGPSARRTVGRASPGCGGGRRLRLAEAHEGSQAARGGSYIISGEAGEVARCSSTRPSTWTRCRRPARTISPEAATFTKDRVAGEAFTKEARSFAGCRTSTGRSSTRRSTAGGLSSLDEDPRESRHKCKPCAAATRT